MQVLSLNVRSAAANNTLRSTYNTPQYPKMDTFRVAPAANSIHVLLSSKDPSALNVAHGNLIKDNIIQGVAYIRSFDGAAFRNGEFSNRVHQLATEMGVKVNINLYYQSNEMEIHGPIHTVDVARVRLLILLDEMCGLKVSSIDKIPMHLHSCIAGRKSTIFQSIMEETGVSIYLQPHLGQLPSNNMIYITGDSEAVAKAQKRLLKVFSQKSNTVYQKSYAIDAYKLDWLLFNKREEIKKIMYDNGSFIQFPERGFKNPSIIVYADSPVYVERSIRFLLQLTSEIYESSFDFSQNPFVDHNQLISLISELTQVSGVNASYMGNHLKLWGTYSQLTVAAETLANCHGLNIHDYFSSFSVEIPTELREFVSGKKNGKLNKIIKSCGVHIDFLNINEYITSIKLKGDNLYNALCGLTKLNDELPAELSFHIPEECHRRIIGVGGKNIQRIMKKHGVYVKFSNQKEIEAIGGYHENEDNVIARTPMKNRDSLLQLREAVINLINLEKNEVFVSVSTTVPYQQHGKIMKAFKSKINEFTQARYCQVYWPQSDGSDKVVVHGPSTSVPKVISYFDQLVTGEHQIVVKVKEEALVKALQQDDFVGEVNAEIVRSKRLTYELLPVTIIKPEDWKKSGVELAFDYYLDSEYVALFKIVYSGSDENENIPEITEMIGKRVEEQGFPFELLSEDISIALAKSLLDSDFSSQESLFDMSSDSSNRLSSGGSPSGGSFLDGSPSRGPSLTLCSSFKLCSDAYFPGPLYPTFGGGKSIWEFNREFILPSSTYNHSSIISTLDNFNTQ